MRTGYVHRHAFCCSATAALDAVRSTLREGRIERSSSRRGVADALRFGDGRGKRRQVTKILGGAGESNSLSSAAREREGRGKGKSARSWVATSSGQTELNAIPGV